MTIIAIDYSILSPGVCICKDFESFKWVSVVNAHLTKKKTVLVEDFQLKYPTIKIGQTISRRRKDPLYHVTERIKLDNYIEQTDLLIKLIKENIDINDDILVSLEGISFGSKGNALVDICQATGIFKAKLMSEILNGDSSRIFVFSPGELKNAIGCKGNAKKMDIFDAFLEDPILESIRDSDMYAAARDEEWLINKDKVEAPFMDMLDSYLGVLKINQILNKK
jgi:Holliday junction resolvasome RuvABC endonuclease subunit